MNMLSLLSGSTASSPASANPQRSAKATGEFDAMVNARSCANDDADAAQPPAEAETADQDAQVPNGVAALSAAAIAMLSTLDRSAGMLSPSSTTGAAATETDHKAATDATTPSAGAQTPVSAAQAALISLFIVADKVLPTPVPEVQDAGAAAPAVSSKSKSLPTSAVPMPALLNAIAAELRPALGIKADVFSKIADAAGKPVSESLDALPVLPSASTMIRDLASMIASHVDPLTPSDVAVVDRHLDLARGDAWLNDLARDIAATAAGGGRLKFGLAPESLGRLDVEVRQGAAGVSVHMTTRSETARDMLTAAQPRIVDEIRAQGVRVAGTEVSTDASGFGGDRAGSTPRQPTGLPIEAALSVPDALSPKSSELVADGRYA